MENQNNLNLNKIINNYRKSNNIGHIININKIKNSENKGKDFLKMLKNINESKIKVKKAIIKINNKKMEEENEEYSMRYKNILQDLKNMELDLFSIEKNNEENVISSKLNEINIKLKKNDEVLNLIERDKRQEKMRKEEEERRIQENRNEILKKEYEERSRKILQEIKRRKRQEEQKMEEQLKKENERKKKIEDRIKKLEEEIQNKNNIRRAINHNVNINNNNRNNNNNENNNNRRNNNDNNNINQPNPNELPNINNNRINNRDNSRNNNRINNNNILVNNRINNIRNNHRQRNIPNRSNSSLNQRNNNIRNDNRNLINNRNNNRINRNNNRSNNRIINRRVIGQDIKNIFEQLPEFKITDISKLKEGEKSCIICLDNFEVNENLVYLPCFHLFHKDCIFNWVKRNAICPFCHLDIQNNLNTNPF